VNHIMKLLGPNSRYPHVHIHTHTYTHTHTHNPLPTHPDTHTYTHTHTHTHTHTSVNKNKGLKTTSISLNVCRGSQMIVHKENQGKGTERQTRLLCVIGYGRTALTVDCYIRRVHFNIYNYHHCCQLAALHSEVLQSVVAFLYC